VPGHNARHVMVGQEPGDALVVLFMLDRVVRLVPADVELLPPAYPRCVNVGDRDAVGTTPTWTHLAVGGYGQANDHRATPRATRLLGAGDSTENLTSERRAPP
jgi:hypothetical protein